jgi:hypothetical protein
MMMLKGGCFAKYMKKLLHIEDTGEGEILEPIGAKLGPFSRQARSQSLYRLRYTRHHFT